MQATSKQVLFTKREKANGKYPLKIRIIYNRQVKYYSTGIDLTKDEFKVLHLNKKLKKQFQDMTYYLEKADTIIGNFKDDFSWAEFEKRFLKASLNDTSQNLNLMDRMIYYRDHVNSEGRIKSGISFTTTYNKLEGYLKRKKLLYTDVTPEFLKKFEKHLLAEELSKSSISIYIRNIRTIFNQAIANNIVPVEIYPFGKNRYSPPATRKVKKALSIEDIKKIYEYKPVSDIECWARDMWLFSYFGNGINVKDIALLKYKNIVGDEINLIRAKTKNSSKEHERVIQIILTDDLIRIIKKWGRRKNLPDNYIFDIINTQNNSAKQEYRDVSQAIKTINKYMKRIALDIKLEKIPTTNYARHSFSTVLKRAGVSIEMISEQLGHSNIRTTQIYLGSFESDQRKAVTKHLTAFKNETQALQE